MDHGFEAEAHEGLLSTSEQEPPNKAVESVIGMTEEQLRSNPVIQRMMQDFFKDQFKNIQMDPKSGRAGKNKNGSMMQGNDESVNMKVQNIKSPSDTTIYAPALQRKLTPEGRGNIDFGTQNVQSLNQDKGATNLMVRAVECEQRGGNIGNGNGAENYAISCDMFNTQQAMNMEGNINAVSHFVENIWLEQHPDDGNQEGVR